MYQKGTETLCANVAFRIIPTHVKGLRLGKDGKVTYPPKYRNASHAIAAKKSKKQKWKAVK